MAWLFVLLVCKSLARSKTGGLVDKPSDRAGRRNVKAQQTVTKVETSENLQIPTFLDKF
jgi:hypothetical protein